MYSKTYIITSVKVSEARTGSKYATLVCKDLTETVTVNVWGVPESNPMKQGLLVRFDNLKKSEDGFLSCTFQFVTLASPTKDEPLLELIPRPVSKKEWLRLGSVMSSLCDDEKHSSFVSRQFDKLYEVYSTRYAARSHHHAFPGGLLQHTYELLHAYEGLHNVLPYKLDHFSVIVACLYHDFGKISEYDSDCNYLPGFFLEGHPFIGAEAIGKILRANLFPDDEVTFIQSCVLSHHGRREWGAPVLPCSPEAYIVSVLDAISGTGVQYDVPTGTRAMDTTIYRLNKPQNNN